MRARVLTVATVVWLPCLLIACWWYATKDGSSIFFPPLSSISQAIKDNWLFARVGSDLWPSIKLFVGGYLLAATVGIAVGTLLGMWPLARRATLPLIDFARAIPAPALISILVIVLGFEQGMKLTAIAFASCFPTLLNTMDGVRGVSPELLDMATVYRLRRRDRILRVILPAASPQIFAGLRISLAVALAVLVFAEMLAGTNGLGYFIIQAQTTYQLPNMWSGIVVLGLLGYFVNAVFVLAERRVMRWHRGWRAQERATGR